MPFLLVFLTSFLLSLVLTPLAARLGLRLNMADEPGGRRKHAGRIARTGGIAIFVSFVVGVLMTQRLDLPRTDPNEFIRIGGLLIGLIIVFVFGLLDDKFEFRPGLQFVAQFVASLVAIASLDHHRTLQQSVHQSASQSQRDRAVVDRAAVAVLADGHDEHRQLARRTRRAGRRHRGDFQRGALRRDDAGYRHAGSAIEHCAPAAGPARRDAWVSCRTISIRHESSWDRAAR